MKNKIFHANDDGSLNFVGDFESIYKADKDPWDQSSPDGSPMATFYGLSRNETINFISKRCAPDSIVCEIGCGTGYLTDQLYNAFPEGTVYGCDISKTAVHIARKNFRHISFFEHNILKQELPEIVDVLILSNILWYVVHDIENLTKNIINSINSSSTVVIHNALFKENQLYAADKVNSIGTLIDFISNHFKELLNENYVIDSKFIRNSKICHDYAILMIRPGE